MFPIVGLANTQPFWMFMINSNESLLHGGWNVIIAKMCFAQEDFFKGSR